MSPGHQGHSFAMRTWGTSVHSKTRRICWSTFFKLLGLANSRFILGGGFHQSMRLFIEHRPCDDMIQDHFFGLRSECETSSRFCGVERLENNSPGDYHPIKIDDLLYGRYRIIDKLGYAGYSTIWLAHDDRQKHLVAVKVGVSSSADLAGFLRDTRTQRDTSLLPSNFPAQGPMCRVSQSPFSCSSRSCAGCRLGPLARLCPWRFFSSAPNGIACCNS